jgi:hypothetical protein
MFSTTTQINLGNHSAIRNLMLNFSTTFTVESGGEAMIAASELNNCEFIGKWVIVGCVLKNCDLSRTTGRIHASTLDNCILTESDALTTNACHYMNSAAHRQKA